MSEQGFTIQVTGRLPARVVNQVESVVGKGGINTVLVATVRDQAALNGLLRRLEDLGVDLVEFHRSSSPPSGHLSRFDVQVVVAGPVGDLTVTALEEQVPVTHLYTSLDIPDGPTMHDVLDHLRAAGLDVQQENAHRATVHEPGRDVGPGTHRSAR